MTDFVRTGVDVIYSRNADFSSPVVNHEFDPYKLLLTEEEFLHFQLVADTGGTTFAIGQFSNIGTFIVKNHDPTNYCTFRYEDLAQATNNQFRVHAGGFCMITSIDTSTQPLFTANSDDTELELFISGDWT